MSIIDKIVNKFDNEDVIKFSDKDNFKEMKSWCGTNVPQLEYNLGVLGLPTGIIEISGISKSGKTTLGLECMSNFLKQDENGIAVILSSENRDNKEYAAKLGIDTDKVIILKIRYVEDMFMKVKKMIQDVEEIFNTENLGDPKFFFLWDSLGATLSKAELDTMEHNTAEMEKAMAKGKAMTKSATKHAQMGAFAKQAKMFSKFLLGEMYDKTIHFIILNHVYNKMDGRGGKKSGGGEWVEYMPTIRLRMAVVGHERLDDEEVAQYSEVKVVKNDFGSRRKTKVEILLGKGFVLNADDIAFAVEEGIIEQVSAKKMSFMKGKMTWSSKRTFYQLYQENNKYLPLLHKKVAKARHENVLDERES